MYQIGDEVVLNNGIYGIVEDIDKANQTLYVYDKDGKEYVVSFQNPIAVFN